MSSPCAPAELGVGSAGASPPLPPGIIDAAAQSSSSKSVEPSAAKSKSKALAKSTVPVPDELRNHPLYRVLKLIGRGGMGNVFLVEHKLTARKEVLKVIHPHLLSRDDVRGRFKREIQSAAKLNHPNVVQTLTAIEEGGLIGLVMEYVEGESLSSMVNRVGSLPVDRARDFVKQIALGLEHAHQQNMVHRDIKPQNLLVSKEGNGFRVRILDFGLAKTTGLAASNSDLTIDGAIIGTPSFMAPEQAINPTDADIRSDLYSLGCTWFFLLTGRSPFEAESPLAILNAHQNKDLKSATGLWVRVRRIELKDGAEFLVGGQRIRFQESMPIDASTREAMLDRIENGSYSGTASIAGHAYSTLCREDYAPVRAVPSTPLVATGKPATRESSLTLIDGEYWIARTEGTPNGMWVRMDQIIVNRSCTFQIGEQRCRFVCAWTRDEI